MRLLIDLLLFGILLFLLMACETPSKPFEPSATQILPPQGCLEERARAAEKGERAGC